MMSFSAVSAVKNSQIASCTKTDATSFNIQISSLLGHILVFKHQLYLYKILFDVFEHFLFFGPSHNDNDSNWIVMLVYIQ